MMRYLFIVILFLHSCNSNSQRIEGIITRVTDGDSYEMFIDGKDVRIRLQGIDCPEYDQPFGKEATVFASAWLNRNAEIVIYGLDRYKRTLADIYVDGENISHLLLENGLAWHYKQYSDDAMLAGLEMKAREAKIGIWSMKNPVPPWDWRRQNRTKTPRFSQSDITQIPEFASPDTTHTLQEQAVFVCNSANAKRFHISRSCRGLQNCSAEVYHVLVSNAIEKGMSPCKFCYP